MRQSRSPDLHKHVSNTAWAFSDVILGQDGSFYTAYRRDDQTISIHARSDDRWFPYARLSLADAGAQAFYESLDIAIDRQGRTHLLYLYETGSGPAVGYARYDGQWRRQVVGCARGVSNATFGEPALSLDASGHAHVAYAYRDEHTLEVRYASTDTGWLPMVVAAIPARGKGTLLHPWVGLDTNGDLHLLYVDDADNLYCRSRLAGASDWLPAQLVVDASATGAAYIYQKPIQDTDGRVHVLYTQDEFDTQGQVIASSVASFVRDAGGWSHQIVVETASNALYAWPVKDAEGKAYALVERWRPDQSQIEGADAYPLAQSRKRGDMPMPTSRPQAGSAARR